MNATTEAIDFRALFADGHTPDEALPNAPRTAPGTLLDLIYHHPDGHVITDGGWTYKVAASARKSGLAASITVERAGRRDFRDAGSVVIYLPSVGHRPGSDEFAASEAYVTPRGSLIELDQVPDMIAVLNHATVLMRALNDDAATALAPEVEHEQADWEAGAEKRQAQKDWQQAATEFYAEVNGLLSLGQTVRVKSYGHTYRSTGKISMVGERDFALSLPKGSRGTKEHSFWNLLELEVERDGKFEPVELPQRPPKPEVLKD